MILRSLYAALSSDSESSQEDLPQSTCDSSDSQVENAKTELVNTSSLAPKNVQAQKDKYISIKQVTPDVPAVDISTNWVPGGLKSMWLVVVLTATSLGLVVKSFLSKKDKNS